MCSYWITSPRHDQGCSPCGPFSACRAGKCSATSTGQEAGARAAWHHRRRWPYVHDTGPRLVLLVCSGAPSTVASGLTKGTAWTRRKRFGHGCSRRGPAVWWRPRPRKARQARVSSPTCAPAHMTRRARPVEHECATPGGALSPLNLRLQGGGGGRAQPKWLRYVKRAGRVEAALPALFAPPRGSRRARGSTRGTAAGVTSADRAPGWTHTHTWGVQPPPHPPPPPSRRLAGIFGDISRWLTAARVGSSATREGIDPPPPPPPPSPGSRNPGGGGGQEQGTLVNPHPNPHPRPTGGGGQGAEAATSTTQVQLDQPPPPSPQGAVPWQPGQFLPPLSPTEKGTAGGEETNRAATAPYADPV